MGAPVQRAQVHRAPVLRALVQGAPIPEGPRAWNHTWCPDDQYRYGLGIMVINLELHADNSVMSPRL